MLLIDSESNNLNSPLDALAAQDNARDAREPELFLDQKQEKSVLSQETGEEEDVEVPRRDIPAGINEGGFERCEHVQRLMELSQTTESALENEFNDDLNSINHAHDTLARERRVTPVTSVEPVESTSSTRLSTRVSTDSAAAHGPAASSGLLTKIIRNILYSDNPKHRYPRMRKENLRRRLEPRAYNCLVVLGFIDEGADEDDEEGCLVFPEGSQLDQTVARVLLEGVGIRVDENFRLR